MLLLLVLMIAATSRINSFPYHRLSVTMVSIPLGFNTRVISRKNDYDDNSPQQYVVCIHIIISDQ